MSTRHLVLRKTEHRYVSERLSAYMDHQLSAQERTRIEAHLQICEPCRQELETLRWTKDLLRKTPTVQIPHSFVVREADVTPQQPVRRQRTLFSMQWATAVVALLLVVVLAGDMFTSGWTLGRVSPVPREVMVEEKAISQELVIVEKEVVVEKESFERETEGNAEPQAVSSNEEKVKVVAPDSKAGAVDVDARTSTPSYMKTEGTPTPSPTLAPVLQTATAVKPEAGPTPESIRLPEHTLEQTPAIHVSPTRTAWRIAEIGLGVMLVSLAIVVVWLRRRM